MNLQDDWLEVGGREAANQHIQQIRFANGLDTNAIISESLVANLETACKVLSEQLYGVSSHFILELIQNADDNSYSHDDPRLELTYTGDTLRVDCNELGFSRANVDAICGLGRSSKAEAGFKTKFVGEKGIGFKSVFRVADVVWIASRDYSFKFDVTTRLGMISPIVAEFPAPIRPGWTSFFLKLRSGGGQDGSQLRTEIQRALETLDSTLLAFLRKLQTVVVTLPAPFPGVPNTTVRRREIVRRDGGDEVLTLFQDSQAVSRYLLHRHRVNGMPADERRDSVRTSEIVVGFPIDNNDMPVVESQQAFAFLPINDYSFSVMLQADFILTANREGIERSSEWNRALRRGFADAIRDSVLRFNTGPLRYVWPRYLPELPGPRDFFEKLRTRLIERLQYSRVLEARDGSWQRPDSLTFVPAKFRDAEGRPVTLSARTEARYLSGSYDDDDLKHLKKLGVKEMDFPSFMRDLRSLVFDNFGEFASRSPEWHSSLAGVLAANFIQSIPDVRRMRLIKLRTGAWVSADDGPAFFPGQEGKFNVPGGIEMRVVDPDVAADPPRRQLYTRLGVTHFDFGAVQDMILKLHAERDTDPARISTVDLVAQVGFLYSTRWRNRGGRHRLWVATAHENPALTRARSDLVYVDSDDTEPADRLEATQLFANDRASFQFLHGDYLASQPEADRADWLKWLDENLGLGKLPHLVSRDALGVVSEDFLYVVRTAESSQWLRLLCDNWKDHYGKWLEGPDLATAPKSGQGTFMLDYESDEEDERSDGDDEDDGNDGDALIDVIENDAPAAQPAPPEVGGRRSLCEILANVPVQCRNGGSRKLRDTYLPLPEVVTASQESVPLIDLPEPTHERWQRLKTLGVGVKNDAKFYMTCLDKFSGTERGLSRAKFLLNQIQARCNGDEQAVRHFFRTSTKPLFFVPFLRAPAQRSRSSGSPDLTEQDLGIAEDEDDAAPSDGTWYPLDLCLWQGPRHLIVNACLSEVYPGCQTLLRDVLKLPDVGVEHIIEECTSFTSEQPLPYILKTLQVLHVFLTRGKASRRDLEPLRNLRIWPLRGPGPQEVRMGSCNRSDEWFVADHDVWLDVFSGTIPMLAFDVDDQLKIYRVMEALDLTERYITKVAVIAPHATGALTLNGVYTGLFRSKYPFIARLMMLVEDEELRRRKLALYREFEVYTAGRIAQLNTVRFRGREVRGRTTPENVILVERTERFELYMRTNYLSSGRPIHELAYKLASRLAIPPAKLGTAMYCIQAILTDDSPAEIHAELDKQRIPRNTEAEEEDFSWMDQMQGGRSGLGGGRGTRGGQGTHGGVGAALGDVWIISADNFHQFSDMFGDGSGVGTEMGGEVGSAGGSAVGSAGGLGGFDVEVFGAGVAVRGAPGFYMDDEANEHLQFLGELELSAKLEQLLGDKYDPETHWTSAHREKAGVPALQNDPFADGGELGKAAFTIEDTDGAFTATMAAQHPEATYWRRRPPTWHLDVKASYGGLDEEFLLTGEQFERARKVWTKKSANRGMPTDVLILVRVFDIENSPKVAFLIDPWRMYQQDRLGFMCDGFMKGRMIQQET